MSCFNRWDRVGFVGGIGEGEGESERGIGVERAHEGELENKRRLESCWVGFNLKVVGKSGEILGEMDFNIGRNTRMVVRREGDCTAAYYPHLASSYNF